MKRTLILMLILNLALMFVGCSSDDDKDDKVSQISFKNLTNAEIVIKLDGIEEPIDIPAGEAKVHNLDKSIFTSGDQTTLGYNVNGTYIATESRVANVTKGEITIVEIISEGGAIVLTNNYFFSIEDIRIYSGLATGHNLISEPLTTGDSVTLLKKAETYTINIGLESGEVDYIFDVEVIDNETTPVSFSKRVFEVMNSSASYMLYKLDNEAYNTIQANGTASRDLGEEFGNQVEFSYDGLYFFAETLTLDYEEESYYALNMIAQGGAIFVVNNSSSNITEIYLSTSDSEEWGPNYMAGAIIPGAEFAWTVSEGLWDVGIVTEEGYALEFYEIPIQLNESQIINCTDAKTIKKTHTSLKNKAHYNFPVNGGRVKAN